MSRTEEMESKSLQQENKKKGLAEIYGVIYNNKKIILDI